MGRRFKILKQAIKKDQLASLMNFNASPNVWIASRRVVRHFDDEPSFKAHHQF